MKPFSLLFLCILCKLILSASAPLVSAEDKVFVPAGFQLYYGSDPKIMKQLQQRMQKGQIVVIELRGLDQEQISTLVDRAHQVGAKVIAYISIGELGQLEKTNFEQFLKQHNNPTSLERISLGKNETFQSWYIDVNNEIWKEFLTKRINQIYKQGVDGLFLDTIDTTDLYINQQAWPIPQRAKSVQAMISLIREIKAISPDKFIMQNRGLNLIEKTVFVGDDTGVLVPGLNLAKSQPHNPDGLLWESAYTHTGDWIEGKEREMIQIQKNGFTTVFTLGYADTKADRKQFFQKSQAARFIPAWGSSTKTLHKELTQGITAE